MRNERSDWNERLGERPPFPMERVPSAERIRRIREMSGRPPRSRRLRIAASAAAAVLACALLALLLVYFDEMPGGWSDRRLSAALGQSYTMDIPLGATPEEAVMKFRQRDALRIIHSEPVRGGFLLIVDSPSGFGIQAEYVRRMWLGWKWTWGAGGGTSAENANDGTSAADYMLFPGVKGLDTPFPLAAGYVLDPSVRSVEIAVSGEGAGRHAAAIIPDGAGKSSIWFVLLPPQAKPTDIYLYDSGGNVLMHKALKGPDDIGIIEMPAR